MPLDAEKRNAYNFRHTFCGRKRLVPVAFSLIINLIRAAFKFYFVAQICLIWHISKDSPAFLLKENMIQTIIKQHKMQAHPYWLRIGPWLQLFN